MAVVIVVLIGTSVREILMVGFVLVNVVEIVRKVSIVDGR